MSREREMIGRASIVCALFTAACTSPNPNFCDETTPCTDGDALYCDVAGEHGPANTCIASPTDAGFADGGVETADARVDAALGVDAGPTTSFAAGYASRVLSTEGIASTWLNGFVRFANTGETNLDIASLEATVVHSAPAGTSVYLEFDPATTIVPPGFSAGLLAPSLEGLLVDSGLMDEVAVDSEHSFVSVRIVNLPTEYEPFEVVVTVRINDVEAVMPFTFEKTTAPSGYVEAARVESSGR